MKEKVHELSSTNVTEQEKHKESLLNLKSELEASQITNTQKLKLENLELDNLRLSTTNKKFADALEESKDELRKMVKERIKLNREIESLKKPTEFDNLLGKFSKILIFRKRGS